MPKNPVYLSDEYKSSLGKLLELSESQETKLKKRLKKEIDAWVDDTSELHQKLQRWSDLVDGIVPETSYPFEGACYDDKTEVLTDSGWKFFKDLSCKDKVYSMNPGTGVAIYAPISATQRFRAEKLVLLSSNSIDLAVTENHNILVAGHSKKNRFIRADKFLSINGGEFKIPLTSQWVGEEHERIYGFEAADWMEFLGWYISEGWTYKTGTIGIAQSSSANPAKCARIEALLKRLGLKFKKRTPSQYLVSCKLIPTEARNELRSLGLCNEKFIPRHYMGMSKDLLGSLMESLILGDGHTQKPSSKYPLKKITFLTYYTTSKRLADDVQELAQKLGFNGRLTCRDRTGNGGTILGRKINGVHKSYEVGFKLRQMAKVGRAKRELVDYSGEVFCATTPYHTLYVRRNGIAQWCGNSNVHIPLVGIFCKVYHSVERRSILGAEIIWYMETLDETLRDRLPAIEEAINYKAKNEWNISAALSDVFYATNRDKLGILEISYVEEYEEGVTDFILCSNEQDFIEEFPDPQSMGGDADAWQAAKANAQSATEENPIEIPYTYDKEIYRGPYAEVVELADFVIFPATAKSLESRDARGYGKRFYLRKGAIKKKASEGIWDKEAVDRLFEKSKNGDNVSNYKRNKEEQQGISRSGKSDDYEFFTLVLRCYLGGSGKDKGKEEKSDKSEKKYLITYSREHEEIMAVLMFPYRVDNYALFRISRKPNSLLGDCIPEMLEDANEETDALHNQRINSRKIAEIPSFKGKKGSKTDFDTSTEDGLWYPGVIFWLEDPASFEQFKVQPVDLRSSLEEEANDMKLSSLLMGVEPFLFSGSPTSNNPDAPGNKTALLIQQSNLRMDDPISELREGVERVGEICLALEYQFGDPQIIYATQDPATAQTQTASIPKRLLRQGIKVRMAGVTVSMNPESEYQKWIAVYQSMVADPMMQAYAPGRWEIFMRALRAGRVQGREKILPSMQILQQQEVQLRKQAMMEMQQEQAQAKQQSQQLNAQAELDQQKNAVKGHQISAQAALQQQQNAEKAKGIAQQSALDAVKHAQAVKALQMKQIQQHLQAKALAQKAKENGKPKEA